MEYTMTRNQIIQISIIATAALGLHLLFEYDLAHRAQTYEEDSDPILMQVKHEYAISCTQGREIDDPFIKCKNLKTFIDKYEGRYVKNIRDRMVSEAGR